MPQEYTMLMTPDLYKGHKFINHPLCIPYTDTNIEKYYPSNVYTREAKWPYFGSVGSSDVHPGFYTKDEWEKVLQEKHELIKRFQAEEACHQTFKYKFVDVPVGGVKEIGRRVKRAWLILGKSSNEYED